ncbi:MAG: S9 family peptidase [Alphaproteobacteria bacterium]|nr:S9 family peptidase [Alphaproteobacteria bacterium]
MRLPLTALLLSGVALAGVPAAVVLDGTPEPDPELVARLRPYLEPRSAGLADLAPDGRSMLVVTRFGDTSQVHRVEQPLGAREQLTFFEEPIRGAQWAPGSGELVFIRDVGGDEQYQLFALREGRAVRLTDGEHRHSSVRFSDDGQRVAYTNNARNGKDTDVRLARVQDGALVDERLVTAFEGSWRTLDFSPDGRRLLVERYVSVTHSELVLIDLETGERRDVSDPALPASYPDAAFLADDSLLVTSNREGDFLELYRVELGKKPKRDRWTLLSEDIDWDVRGLTVSQDHQHVAFIANVEGSSALYLMDPADGSMREVPLPPTSQVGGLEFAEAAPVLGLSLGAADRPDDVYTLDVESLALTRWTRSEVGGLDPEGFVVPELIRYESFDGLSVPAFIYRPEGPGPHPVMISVHGGPEAQARPRFSGVYQYLVDRGVAVVIPNVRGSNGYGKAYVALDDGVLREDSVKDIGALLDFIEADPGLDGARVGIRGGSYGGYMVLASLVHHGDRLVAGCDNVGISNFVTFLENTKDYRRDLRRVEYGDERDPEMRAHLEAISPLTRADEIRSALFVAHGANDPRVPVGEAEQLVEAVRSNGQEVWYMLAQDEGHGFAKKPNRDLYTALMMQFFEQHLLGSE